MSDNLFKKWQIKKGMEGTVLHAPPEFERFVMDLTDSGYTPASEEADFTICFVTNEDEVLSVIPAVYDMKIDGLLWMVYPKKESGIRSAISRDSGWGHLHDIGYKSVAIISANDSWAALRFRSTSFIKSAKQAKAAE